MSTNSDNEVISTLLEKLLDPNLVQASFRRVDGVRISARPVEIKGRRLVQVSVYDGRKTAVANYGRDELAAAVEPLLRAELRSAAVSSINDEFHIQFSRKGRPITHSKVRKEPVAQALEHDRVIDRPLPEGEPNELLQAIGLTTVDGKVKADRRRKFIQINEFIRIVMEAIDLDALGQQPLILDCGCGNAYLSFALHHYLTSRRHVAARLIGIDRTADLIRRNRGIVEKLGLADIEFEVADIGDYVPPAAPTIVTALHACDTATDAALAKALSFEAPYIFCAPCCHHHLQAQPKFGQASTTMRPMFSSAILRERLGDLLTDSFRALILRLAGYNVDVIEFTSPEHTAKNLLIRARKSTRPVEPGLLAEYRQLKTEFGVTPFLETLVGSELRGMLG